MKNIIINEYGKAISHIRDNKKLIYIAGIIYISFFLIGLLQPVFSEEVRGIDIKDKTSLEIFFNNFYIDFFLKLLMGATFFVPISLLIFNGYVIGFMMADAIPFLNVGFLLSFLTIAFLELSMGFISAGLGMKLGVNLITGEYKKFGENYLA